MFNSILEDNNRGQSLIEVIIAIIIASVVLGALVNLILNGLKNAQFAQNQTKATHYAQEAIDQIRNIRDQDMAGKVQFQTVDSNKACQSLSFSSLFSYYLSSTDLSNKPKCSPGYSPCSNPLSGSNLKNDGCYFVFGDNTNTSIQEAVSIYYQPISSDLSFKRLIKISDQPYQTVCPNSGSTALYCDYRDEKTVSVQILWTDVAGDHQSSLQTILGQKYEN